MALGAKLVDLSAKRELHRGFGDALSAAVELAGTPALFAFLGWRLDAWLGTSPLLLVFLFAFTFGYMVWKLFMRYDAQMRNEEARFKSAASREERKP
jgi:F0F1-type ATP synthase assembly protein I